MSRTIRRTFILVGVMCAMAALGLGIWWWLALRHQATPDVVEGWAMPNAAGDAIWLLGDLDDSSNGNGYIIAGASWTGLDGAFHQGSSRPTCVGTDTSVKKRVRLGVVDIDDSEFGGWQHVVWLKCLE